MTLDEAFAKYPDETILRRKYKPESCGMSIEILKSMQKQCNNQHSLRTMIPQFMLDDIKAKDWIVLE